MFFPHYFWTGFEGVGEYAVNLAGAEVTSMGELLRIITATQTLRIDLESCTYILGLIGVNDTVNFLIDLEVPGP